MNPRTEQRLRAAFEAKADQVTEERLERLAAQRHRELLDGVENWAREESSISLFDGAVADHEPTSLDPERLDHRPGATRHARWLAPAMAAAAVAAIAVAVAAIATFGSGGSTFNPPAGMVNHPTASTSAPAPGPTGPTGAPASRATELPPYLPRGQQGSRSQVPWSAVGSGWRLVLPFTGDAAALYLYDPAGGRYLISDRLPAQAALLAWSPDGTRAMLRSGSSDAFHYQEVRLRTGELTRGFAVPLSNFVSYTQPKGLAVLIQQTEGLVRYDTAGRVQHRYATDLPGLGKFNPYSALYLLGGGQLVTASLTGPLVLLSNDGQLVRTFPLPAGYQSCSPVKWWTGTSVLERCYRLIKPSEVEELYLQPVAGGQPTPVTAGGGRYGLGYFNAWPISNGHTLLENSTGCGVGGYDVLLGDGSTRPLRGPAGFVAGTPIVNVDGDLVTFQHRTTPGCGDASQQHYEMVDYDLVTGASSTLLDGTATMASWPGEQPR